MSAIIIPFLPTTIYRFDDLGIDPVNLISAMILGRFTRDSSDEAVAKVLVQYGDINTTLPNEEAGEYAINPIPPTSSNTLIGIEIENILSLVPSDKYFSVLISNQLPVHLSSLRLLYT